MDFPYALEVFSAFCLWNCVVAFLQEGGPGYLANFLWQTPKKSNLHWVDGFPLCFGGFFWILLTKLRYCIFAGGRPRVLSKFPLKNQQNSNSELGRWISPMLLMFFGILLVKWRGFIFGGGRPMALSKFPLENPQNSKSELGAWISPYVLEVFSGFCLWNCVVAFLQERGPG